MLSIKKIVWRLLECPTLWKKSFFKHKMDQSTEKVVESLLKGINVGEFNDEEIENAKPVLIKRKEKAINEGDIDCVRNIQGIMEKIETRQQNCAQQQKQAKKEKAHLPKLTKIKQNENEKEESEYKDILQQLVDGSISYNAVETDDIEGLIRICKEKIKDLSSQRKLLDAQKHEDCFQELMRLNEQRKKEHKINTKETNLENQIQTLEQNINEMRKDMNQKLAEHDNETKEWLTNTEIENNDKYHKFDQETQDTTPKEVAKPSPELLNIKQKADFLISLRRFAEAAQLDKEAEVREQKELENAVKNHQTSRRIKKEKMVKGGLSRPFSRCEIEMRSLKFLTKLCPL